MVLAVKFERPVGSTTQLPVARVEEQRINGEVSGYGNLMSETLVTATEPAAVLGYVWEKTRLTVTVPLTFYNQTFPSPPEPPEYSQLRNGDVVRFSLNLRRRQGTGTWSIVASRPRTFTYPSTGLGSTEISEIFTGLLPEYEYEVQIGAVSVSSYYTPRIWPGPPARTARFHAERAPTAPVITAPTNNISLAFDSTGEVTMEWTVTDPDNAIVSSRNTDLWGWQVQYRPAPVPGQPEPEWTTYNQMPGSALISNPFALIPIYALTGIIVRPTSIPVGARGFPIPSPGTYQFRVRTQDKRWEWENDINGVRNYGAVSPWSSILTLTWTAPYLPPLTIAPSANEAAVVDEAVDFSWQFRDPRTTGGTQNRREIQIREVGTETWTEVIPVGAQSSAAQTYSWTGASAFLEPGKQYEWQARTRSTPGNHVSTWSESAYFWAVPPPNSGGVIPIPDITVPMQGLGSGNNRAFIYDRGGIVPRGELVNKSRVVWHRKRDDMASASVRIDTWDAEYADFLGTIRSWQHEIVIFRESNDTSERVWEGPITRITYGDGYVEFEAHDVMAYPYRRILRQGYNDAYVFKTGAGLSPVTVRAMRVLQNALSYDDPNVLAYMRPIIASDDARQSRVVPDFASTAYEDVDDMAASAGLDYCVAGRSIILWDTHNELGRLPEMRNGDFEKPPILTEYGMRMANIYAITNNNGIYGVASRLPTPTGDPVFGYVEMIDSAYGETDDGGLQETLTEEARIKLVETLTGQADRAIAPRYPTPIVARVPDNSRLMPHVAVGINQLIPGVYIPLRAGNEIRSFAQMQKLDMVTVEQIKSAESVRITLSPAPGFGGLGDDPVEEG